MNNQNFIFVYAKNKRIKVLGLEGSKEEHDFLISDGWIHSATLDPCKWLEYLHNTCELEDLHYEILELSNPINNHEPK